MTSLDEWIKFFDNNNEFITDVNFGTGENSLIDEWFDLIVYINTNFPAVKQALTTNGTLMHKIDLDPKKGDIVADVISEIDVSLDYGVREQHNRFRGNEKAFDWATQTLDFCNQNSIMPTVVTMGIDDNLTPENMELIFNIAEKYDSLIRINLYRPVVKNNGLHPPQLSTVIALLDWIHENHEICSLSDPLFSSIFTTQDTKSDPSGRHSVRILPSGFIYPSTYLIDKQFKTYHISDENALQRVGTHPVIERIKSAPLPDDCRECSVSETCCGGTIDRRYLWFGNLEKRDPYCPEELGLAVKLRDYTLKPRKFTSIHDGYLPTMFFRPKKETKW